MPLVTFDAPVSRISGRLGSNPSTFTFNNGAPVLRAQVGPANPDTDDQQAIRAIFSVVTKNWKLLTQAQRTAWTAWAQTHNVTNRLGRSVGRNGISAYVELATGHYIDTAALLSAAPTLPQPSAPTGITITASQAGGNQFEFNVQHGYSTLTGLYLVARMTPSIPYESQTPKLGDYRLVQGVSTTSIVALAATNTGYNFNATKYSYDGDPAFVGIECSIMNAEGWQSVPTRAFLDYAVA